MALLFLFYLGLLPPLRNRSFQAAIKLQGQAGIKQGGSWCNGNERGRTPPRYITPGGLARLLSGQGGEHRGPAGDEDEDEDEDAGNWVLACWPWGSAWPGCPAVLGFHLLVPIEGGRAAGCQPRPAVCLPSHIAPLCRTGWG